MECSRCLLPDQELGTVLGSRGLCNYCEHWDTYGARITDYEALRPLFLARLESCKGKGPYDAILGFSGGKDSTYVLYQLTRQLGLKVLAFTFDNGFLSAHARSQIERLVRELDVEHFFFRPDPDMLASFYGSALRSYGNPCIACAFPGYYLTIKYAFEQRIPLVFHGRSPFQIYRNFRANSDDAFLTLHQTNLEPHSPTLLRDAYRVLHSAAQRWLHEIFADERERQRAFDAYFFDPDAYGGFVPDFVGFFQYRHYDEEEIKRQLETETSFRRPEQDRTLGHGDCDIHDVAGYLFQKGHGGTLIRLEVASMLRHGAIDASRARALVEEAKATVEPRPTDAIRSLCATARMPEQEFINIEAKLERREFKRFGPN